MPAERATGASSRRLDDLIRFYSILDGLEESIGGRRTLAACHGRLAWPQRGVYFFMEQGEHRTDSGERGCGSCGSARTR